MHLLLLCSTVSDALVFQLYFNIPQHFLRFLTNSYSIKNDLPVWKPCFKNSPKWTIFAIFNYLLSTQNGNVARFARNVEFDFYGDFQTLYCDLKLTFET